MAGFEGCDCISNAYVSPVNSVDCGVRAIVGLMGWFASEMVKDPGLMADEDGVVGDFLRKDMSAHYIHRTLCKAYEDAEAEKVSGATFCKLVSVLRDIDTAVMYVAECGVRCDRLNSSECIRSRLRELIHVYTEYMKDASLASAFYAPMNTSFLM